MELEDKLKHLLEDNMRTAYNFQPIMDTKTILIGTNPLTQTTKTTLSSRAKSDFQKMKMLPVVRHVIS